MQKGWHLGVANGSGSPLLQLDSAPFEVLQFMRMDEHGFDV